MKLIRPRQSLKVKGRTLKGIKCPKCSKLMKWELFESNQYDDLIVKNKDGKYSQYCSLYCITKHFHKYHQQNQLVVYYKRMCKMLNRKLGMFTGFNS